jgi:pilus assembly protein Flp/PilA
MKNFFQKMLGDKSGASAAEYALILALVGVAIIVGAGTLGDSIDGAFNDSATEIDTAMAG